MEVLSFLELALFQSPELDAIKYKIEFARLWQNKLKFKNAKEFYAQEFKPELITELFEDWHHSEKNIFTKDYVYKAYEHLIRFDLKLNRTYLYKNKFYFIPKTLDDFIILCKLAGIKLQWREK